MRYNEFAKEAKGIPGITSAADLAILLGLLLFIRSSGPEECCVSLFSDGPSSPQPLSLVRDGGVLAQFEDAKAKINGMAKTTDLPIAWLEEKLQQFPADRIVIFSDMLIGQNRNHPGGGGKLQDVLKKHREISRPESKLVCVDLFGSGAATGLDLTGDIGKGDLLLSGFSDSMLSYIANPTVGAQVADVENVLELLHAEEAKREAALKQRKKGKDASTTGEDSEGEDGKAASDSAA